MHLLTSTSVIDAEGVERRCWIKAGTSLVRSYIVGFITEVHGADGTVRLVDTDWETPKTMDGAYDQFYDMIDAIESGEGQ